MRKHSLALTCVLGLLLTSVAHATSFDDVTSDLSNAFATPTLLSLTLGSNVITGQTGTQSGIDRDFFRVSVPTGFRISAINLISTDTPSLSFLGVESGTAFTDPATTGTAQLLGYVHFGQSLAGTDILDNIGTGAGAQGFTGSLNPGNYSFWLQENSTPVVNYKLDLVLSAVPAAPALPAGMGLLLACALGGLGMLCIGRRTSRQVARFGA